MVSTRSCPRCGTKNSKNAEVCYNCQNSLKSSKKPRKIKVSRQIKFNTKSLIDPKVVAIGTAIFVLSYIIFLDIAYEYSALICGFGTMIFLYFVFKNTEDSANTRRMGLKIVVNYLSMALAGVLILVVLNFYSVIKLS